MGKSMRAALLFEGFVLAAALVYLVAFLFSGLRMAHGFQLLNISLVLATVVAATLLTARLWQRTLYRESLVRRFFVSPHWVYNAEIGFAPIGQVTDSGDSFGFVTFAAETLANMSYGFDVAQAPNSFDPKLVIDSHVFHVHNASEDPEDSIVVDKWWGMLHKVVGSDAEGRPVLEGIGTFSNAGELARLLDDSGVFEYEALQEDAA